MIDKGFFEAQRDGHKVFEFFVAVHGGFQLRCFHERGFEFDTERRGNHFGQAVNFPVRDVHRAADVFYRGFGGHGAEGDDL